MALQDTGNEGENGGSDELLTWIKNAGLSDDSKKKVIDNGLTIDILNVLASEPNKKDQGTMINDLIDHLKLNIMDKLKFKKGIGTLAKKFNKPNNTNNNSDKVIVLVTHEEHDAVQGLYDDFKGVTDQMRSLQNMILTMKKNHGQSINDLTDETNAAIKKLNQRKSELTGDLDRMLKENIEMINNQIKKLKEYSNILSDTKIKYQNNLKNTELDQNERKTMNVEMITEVLNGKPPKELNMGIEINMQMNSSDILDIINRWKFRYIALNTPTFKLETRGANIRVITMNSTERTKGLEIFYTETTTDDTDSKEDKVEYMEFKANELNTYDSTNLKHDTTYSVKLRYTNGLMASLYSAPKSLKTLPKATWDPKRNGGNLTMIEDNWVQFGQKESIALGIPAITAAVYKSFTFKIIVEEPSWMYFGFIGGTVDKSIKNWKASLLSSSNKNVRYIIAKYNDGSKDNSDYVRLKNGEGVDFKINFRTQKATAEFNGKVCKKFSDFGNEVSAVVSNSEYYPAEYRIEYVTCEYA